MNQDHEFQKGKFREKWFGTVQQKLPIEAVMVDT